jgi:hypothetical protein
MMSREEIWGWGNAEDKRAVGTGNLIVFEHQILHWNQAHPSAAIRKPEPLSSLTKNSSPLGKTTTVLDR